MSEQIGWKVGDGATVFLLGDRVAYTVVKVTKHFVTLQKDHAVMVEGGQNPLTQRWECTPNPDGEIFRFKVESMHGPRVAPGRAPFHDYDF